jgi:hypothetical protein
LTLQTPRFPPPPPPTISTSTLATAVGTTQLQAATSSVKVTVVNPFSLTSVGLQVVIGVPDTPAEAELEIVPFNARNKTV